MAVELSGWPLPRLAVAGVTLILPSVVGWIRSPGYVVEEPIVAFPLGTEWFSVCFPVLAGVIGCWPLIRDVQGNVLKYTRTRAAPVELLRRKLSAGAAASASVFAASMLLWCAVCFWLDPYLGHSSNYGLPPQGNALNGTAWAMMLDSSPWVFSVVYSVWVGMWAALFSMLTGIAVLMLSNLALAIMFPLVAWFVNASVFQAIGLGGMNVIFSVFPFSMANQPWWMILVSVVLWLGGLFCALQALRARVPELPCLG